MNGFGAFSACWILLLLIVGAQGDQSPCDNLQQELPVCNQTQYEEYRTCVEEVKEVRSKRQALCPQFFASEQTEAPPGVEQPVMPEVHQVSLLPVVQIIPAMTSVVTVKPVESNDIPPFEEQPTKVQLKSLRRKVIVQGDDEDDNIEYHVPANVTTVIRLTNIVNNTNIVNVPTNVNTTNVNNIHIYANITEGGESTQTAEAKCCTAVQPKKCQQSTQGLMCKHKKHRMCGPQCTADVMHVQRRKRCDNQGNCKQKLAYVPQPEKPTCVYIDQWPFVACGKPANMEVICDGCYDHYGHGSQAYNGQIPNQCRGCYDDGFDYGPMYRRGPVLRPFYYHEPPCYLTGTCPMAYGGDCGYGCYGHDMIDPAWGPPQSPYDPQMDDTNTGYFSEDLEVSNGTDTDWGVPVHKCTVLSEDNTLVVQNCTDTVDNQYAAAPENYPYYKPIQYPPQKMAHKGQQYKVKKRMQQPAAIVNMDDSEPSSGAGPMLGGDHVSAFVVDDDEYDDYSL